MKTPPLRLPACLSALAFAAILSPVFAAPAMAEGVSPYMLPAGQTILNISATERTEVPQDLLIASLRIEKTGPDARKVQNDINALMKAAVSAAKAVPTVKISTGGYYVYEETPVIPVPIKSETRHPATQKIWRGSQTLELKSTAPDTLLKLVGDLQSMGLLAGGLNYALSPEKADETRDNLMEAALTKLKTRAIRAAKAMGKTQTDLIEVNVESNNIGPRPFPVMRAMAMSADAGAKMDAPSAEPGETEITLTVSARALLKP